ncbi:transcription factor DIVARICATA-like [Lotus japonicus]|uniref:transcription factor DIVARICATA-like n=1 Tax=Lotus japonicus TaxID=34305 RepID=UPI0025829554|nr:transcription factor DIVARICATA-like [Lotus japonicus]
METPYRNQEWTEEEEKTFEYALAIFDEDTPDRWENVAAVLPRKTALDVIMHYKKLEEDTCGIEAGPVPPFLDSSFSPEMAVGDHSDGGSKKRSATESSSENKRKKVFHWTEDEHKLFLLGLQECGKGAWRNIARKFVVTKTPTQVASHAQKYYIRQKLSEGGKDDNKKRSSIHDITLLDIMENTTRINDKSLPLIQESQIMSSPPQQMKETSIQNVQLDSIDVGHNNNPLMIFNPSNDYEVGGAQQIQNVQPGWISCDHNNDQLMGFNPNNDGMSMLSSQDYAVTGAEDLYDILSHFICAKRQSSGFKMSSS